MTRANTARYQTVSAVRTLSRRLRTMNLVAQSVAIAAQRLDDGRRAVAVELAPQGADIDVDDIALAVELPAPHALGYLRAAQRLAGMAQKKLEHGVLARRERDRLRAARHRPGAEIHRDVAGDQPVAGAQDRPPQQGADAGQQLGKGEGFHQVVVGAGIEPADAVVDGGARRGE